MKRVLLVLAIMLAFTSHCPAADSGPRIITVSGSGSVLIEPDVAVVKMGVDVLKKTATEAQAENAALMTKVISSIAAKGISKDKIQTSGFNIFPEYRYEEKQPARLVGYRCTNTVAVIIEDMGKISKVIDGGVGAGANSVSGIQFSREDDLDQKKQALDIAVKEARAKADAIALAAGIKIKGVENISEGVTEIYPVAMERMSFKDAASSPSTPVAPGNIEIRGSVTVIYSIE